MNYVVNLNGIVLAPFQVFMDLAGQFDCSRFHNLVFKPVTQLNTTHDWVNLLDSLGDPVALRAHELVAYFRDSIKESHVQSMTINIDLQDKDLTIDNLYALFYLSFIVPQLKINFYVFLERVDKLKETIAFLESRSNIAIQIFAEPLNQSFEVMTQQLKKRRDEFLFTNGYSFYDVLDEKLIVSMNTLGNIISYSWACLKAGAYPLSCLVLEEALKFSTSHVLNENFFMHLQIIRFLSHQHHKIMSENFPDEFVSLNLSDTHDLFYIKSFSATLTRHLDVAEKYLKKANVSVTMPLEDDDSLYKLNLNALYFFIKGELDTAFLLEKQLNAHIEENEIDRIALRHVVLINIARLHKKANQLEEASHYYEKAYNELSGGGFTLFDLIYYDLNQCGLLEAQEKHKEALFVWIRIALNWLTSPNPYALAIRNRLVLCREKITDVLKPISREKVNKFLLGKIIELCDRESICLSQLDDEAFFHFTSWDMSPTIKASHIIEDLVFYSCENNDIPTLELTESEHALRNTLSSLIKKFLPSCQIGDTLLIENRLENYYPKSEVESIALSSFSGAQVCYYLEKIIQNTPALHDESLKNIKVKLSKMISVITKVDDGLALKYKRSFLDHTIRLPDEIELIDRVMKQDEIEYASLDKLHADTFWNLFCKKALILDFQNI